MKPKVSVIVGTGSGQRNSILQQCIVYGIYQRKESAPKKKFKGFPMFFTFENF
jgi:hypothetical protein